MDLQTLQTILPYAGPRAAVFLPALNIAMTENSITGPLRQAAFIAQIGHESGSLRYVREIASGLAYEGRADLGNTRAGDGVRFKGRGLIQITGRANYQECSRALYGDDRLLATPELLEHPAAACRSAAWYWHTRGLNELADARQIERITRRINGGLNGQAERLALYQQALRVLT